MIALPNITPQPALLLPVIAIGPDLPFDVEPLPLPPLAPVVPPAGAPAEAVASAPLPEALFALPEQGGDEAQVEDAVTRVLGRLPMIATEGLLMPPPPQALGQPVPLPVTTPPVPLPVPTPTVLQPAATAPDAATPPVLASAATPPLHRAPSAPAQAAPSTEAVFELPQPRRFEHDDSAADRPAADTPTKAAPASVTKPLADVPAAPTQFVFAPLLREAAPTAVAVVRPQAEAPREHRVPEQPSAVRIATQSQALGPVDLKVTLDQGTVSVVLAPERADTAMLLREMRPQLATTLREIAPSVLVTIAERAQPALDLPSRRKRARELAVTSKETRK